jgi:hypothetical protein
MGYSVAAAAAAAGVSKTTVLRAVQAGRISGTKNEVNEWQVDPAELHRLAELRRLDAPVARCSEVAASIRGHALQTDARAISGRAGAIRSRSRLLDMAQAKRLSGLAISDQKAQQAARTRWWHQVTGH